MLLTLLILALALAAAAWAFVSFRKRAERVSPAVPARTAAAAIALFWLAETGIERRVMGPVELFRFAGEGGFLPGKAAVLLLCVLVCLFAGLTSPGERLRAKLEAAAEKDGVLWLFSLAVTGLFFLWAMRVTVVSFMTNDETSLMRTIAAIPERGLSYASYSFSSVLFCGFLSLFYRIDPEGYWYAYYHLAVIFISCGVVGRCVLLKARRRGWPLGRGLLLHGLLCFGVYLYPLAELSFTVTPALAGSAAMALLLCRDELPTPARRAASDIGGIALMLLGFLQRPNSGKVMLCFWGLAFAYVLARTLLRRRDAWKREVLGLGASLLALLVLMGASRSSSVTGADYDGGYWDAEYYRSIVMDYLAPELTDEQFEAAGIPAELATLLRNWYFMDRRVNTGTFRTLTELYYEPPEASEAQALLPALPGYIAETGRELTLYPVRTALTCAAGALLLLDLLAFLRGGKRAWPELAAAVCAAGGGFLLCLYLVANGRFPFRVFLLVFTPVLMLLTLLALSAPRPEKEPEKRRAFAVLAWVLAAGCGAAALAVVWNAPHTTEYADRASVFSSQWAVEAYAGEHSGTGFVTNFYAQNLDPFHGPSYPGNMWLWGGTGVTSLADDERYYDDDFFRDDIRFMYESPSTVIVLLQYLTLDHGPVQASVDAQLTPTICVADLDEISPGEGFTGWYEQNGFTYYFENGQAVTGTHSIDGTEYTFAPPGAASVFAALPGERLTYTTNAYALVSGD